MATTEERVRKVILDLIDGVTPEKVTLAAAFVEDLGCDSLDTIELIMAFEEEFDLSISDDECEQIKTVGDAVAALDAKLKAAA